MKKSSKWYYGLGIFLTVFGLLTIKEGGSVLFFDPAARVAAGNFVPFVVWFNFLAGFAYSVAGVGVVLGSCWARNLAIAIAGLTALIFLAFAAHIFMGGLYEVRTLAAMTLRTSVWMATAFLLVKRGE